MVKAKFLLGLSLCLLSFYITALISDSKVSEISCAKILWYLTLLNTNLEMVCALNRIGAVIILGNHETTLNTIFFWHKSKALALGFLLCQVSEFFAKGILFYNIVSMSSSCKERISEHSMLWHAAELQAYIFIISVGLLAVAFIFFLNALLVLQVFGRNFRQLLEVQAPEPVPVNHGIELVVDGETKPGKPVVKKTDDEEKLCSICRENEKTHACIPCGHLCLCAMCAEDLSKRGVKGQNKTRCPICRVEADNFSMIYQ